MKKTITIITENYEVTEKLTREELNKLINQYYEKGNYTSAMYYLKLKEIIYDR